MIFRFLQKGKKTPEKVLNNTPHTHTNLNEKLQRNSFFFIFKISNRT